MHSGPVVAIRNVDAAIACDWVGIDGERGDDTVLPLLLHLCMHHEE